MVSTLPIHSIFFLACAILPHTSAAQTPARGDDEVEKLPSTTADASQVPWPADGQEARRRIVRRISTDMQEAAISPHGQVLFTAATARSATAANTVGGAVEAEKEQDKATHEDSATAANPFGGAGASDNGPGESTFVASQWVGESETKVSGNDITEFAEQLAKDAGYVIDNSDAGCYDAETSGRTTQPHGQGRPIPETCNQLMYSFRHYKGSACDDHHHGAVIRKNCKRSCGCCCKDNHRSGTHDKNGLEVTCSQVAMWMTSLKYDYCGDSHFGATVRENCPSLCCTCNAAANAELFKNHLDSNLNESIPYREIQEQLASTMQRLSQAAEGVEAMGARVPAILSLISGSTTSIPRPMDTDPPHEDAITTTPGTEPEVWASA